MCKGPQRGPDELLKLHILAQVGVESTKSTVQEVQLMVTRSSVMKPWFFAWCLGGIVVAFDLFGASPGTGSLPPIPPPISPKASSAAPGNAVLTTQTVSTAGAGGRPTAVSPTNRYSIAPGPGVAVGKPGVLEFDSTSKHVDLTEGEKKASFSFSVTNRSTDTVTISYINTSCGCTAGKLPTSPWVLKSGEGGFIDVTMDVTGKLGTVTKTATVVASTGSYPLSVSVTIPTPSPTTMDRTRNTQIALADRQAVFRNDCAACHAQPVYGKSGRELYDAACGICHEAEHRATMVPDLRTRLKNTDQNYWAKWISDGRVGSLMPAFAARNGGPLSDAQIASLVQYLEEDYKKNPPPSKLAASPGASPSGTSVNRAP